MKLILENIRKYFNDKKVLTGVYGEFESSKIYGLLGRNGAGKTTLFSIIYDEIKADTGSVEIEINGEIKPIHNDDVGMVFAENILPDFLTGYEYIKFILDITEDNDPSKIDTKSVDDYLDFMEITQEDRHKLLKFYSSGMKSKISLLTIYIQKPKVILLDEPLTAVDVVSGAEIKRFFRQLKNDHIILVSTHMLDLAKDLCDEIVLLHNGKLQALENLEKDENYENIIVEALRSEDV